MICLRIFACNGDKTQWKVYEPVTENILSLVADFGWSMTTVILARKSYITSLDAYLYFPEVILLQGSTTKQAAQYIKLITTTHPVPAKVNKIWQYSRNKCKMSSLK